METLENLKELIIKKKENKASIQSKRRIREAYLQLLQDNKDVNKDIRIVEIVKQAGVNRGTFYAYYPSIDALERDTAMAITQKLLTPILESPFKDIVTSPFKYIELIAETIEKNLDLFKKLEKTRYADDFIYEATLEFLKKAKTDSSMKELKDRIVDEKLFDFTVLAMLNGLIGVARECLRGTIQIPQGQFAEYVSEAVQKLTLYVKEITKFDNVLQPSTAASGDYNA